MRKRKKEKLRMKEIREEDQRRKKEKGSFGWEFPGWEAKVLSGSLELKQRGIVKRRRSFEAIWQSVFVSLRLRLSPSVSLTPHKIWRLSRKQKRIYFCEKKVLWFLPLSRLYNTIAHWPLYIHIYHHRHHVTLAARMSLTFTHLPSLSSIAAGMSSKKERKKERKKEGKLIESGGEKM